VHRLAHASSSTSTRSLLRHYCNSSNYTNNTKSDKHDVGLYPWGAEPGVNARELLFLSQAVESAIVHTLSMNQKPLNMGIARVEPRQYHYCSREDLVIEQRSEYHLL
jgi:hypothetical protein